MAAVTHSTFVSGPPLTDPCLGPTRQSGFLRPAKGIALAEVLSMGRGALPTTQRSARTKCTSAPRGGEGAPEGRGASPTTYRSERSALTKCTSAPWGGRELNLGGIIAHYSPIRALCPDKVHLSPLGRVLQNRPAVRGPAIEDGGDGMNSAATFTIAAAMAFKDSVVHPYKLRKLRNQSSTCTGCTGWVSY